MTEDEYKAAIMKVYDQENWPLAPIRQPYPLPLLPDERLPLSTISRRAIDRGYIDIFGNDIGETVYVCVTHFQLHEDARDALVSHLMKSTCPRLPLGSERGLSIGNVCVTGLSSNPLLNIAFIRDHTFVWVRSIGDQPYDVLGFAEVIDASIAEK